MSTKALESKKVPDIATLEKATLDVLGRAVHDSDRMREELRAQFGLAGVSDKRWRKFVNNHAWALVRLQSRGQIHKTGLRQYELGLSDEAPRIDGDPLPKWARQWVSIANSRNKKHAAEWGPAPPFRMKI